MPGIQPLTQLRPDRFETPAVLKRLAVASRRLAELKGVAASMPNQGILISTLGLREAKDSSAIENIITTHDALFRDAAQVDAAVSAETKEVARYGQALRVGFEAVTKSGLLTNRHILDIQAVLELNDAGFRKLPGTTLKAADGRVVYTPPQDADEIVALMQDLERFINDDAAFDVDPLIKMALIHHQFESIHPFYDGNGRTGRIVNVLYLVKHGLLDIPVLYLSRYIVRTKATYYRLLQEVRDRGNWEDWVVYLLDAVEKTSTDAIATIQAIKALQLKTKHEVRARLPRIYSQDLLNNLFAHPYTKIDFVQRDLHVSRLTAASYLRRLTEAGFLQMHKVGRSNFYLNAPLYEILAAETMQHIEEPHGA